MSKTKKQKGVNIIQKNVDKFQSIITGLEKGEKLCDVDITKNKKIIEALNAQNSVIKESKSLASTFRTNLSNMLKVPAKDADDVEKKKDK